MNKFISGAFIAAALALSFCKTKKAVTVVAEDQFGRQLVTASERWPGVTEAELRDGHTIYTTRCTRCHGNFEITGFSEEKWLRKIDEMAPKAKLTAEEKEKLTRHILSYRQTYAVTMN